MMSSVPMKKTLRTSLQDLDGSRDLLGDDDWKRMRANLCAEWLREQTEDKENLSLSQLNCQTLEPPSKQQRVGPCNAKPLSLSMKKELSTAAAALQAEVQRLAPRTTKGILALVKKPEDADRAANEETDSETKYFLSHSGDGDQIEVSEMDARGIVDCILKFFEMKLGFGTLRFEKVTLNGGKVMYVSNPLNFIRVIIVQPAMTLLKEPLQKEETRIAAVELAVKIGVGKTTIIKSLAESLVEGDYAIIQQKLMKLKKDVKITYASHLYTFTDVGVAMLIKCSHGSANQALRGKQSWVRTAGEDLKLKVADVAARVIMFEFSGNFDDIFGPTHTIADACAYYEINGGKKTYALHGFRAHDGPYPMRAKSPNKKHVWTIKENLSVAWAMARTLYETGKKTISQAQKEQLAKEFKQDPRNAGESLSHLTSVIAKKVENTKTTWRSYLSALKTQGKSKEEAHAALEHAIVHNLTPWE